MKDKHKGAHAELRACAWLLEQGYEVFRNVSSHGKIDLVAIKDGEVRFFDVKFCYRGGSTSEGIEFLTPMADGSFQARGPARKRTVMRELTPREKVIQRMGELST